MCMLWADPLVWALGDVCPWLSDSPCQGMWYYGHLFPWIWLFDDQLCVLFPDESGSQKAPWGINIMKKTKKSAPRAFGVRLEDCQPAPDNKVYSSDPHLS